MKTGALILAGGQSRRMEGVRKEEIPWGNTTFLGLLCCRLWEFQEKLISVGKGSTALVPGWKTVEDEEADPGPLGGIVSAFHASGADALLVVSCDMPFLPQDLPETLIRLLMEEGCDVCISQDDQGRDYPLCAAYSRSALPTLKRAVKSGHFRVMDALTGLSLHRVAAGSPLLNLNTPEQVRAFRDQYFRLDLDTALERILGAVPGTAGAEILPLNQCAGRFLAQDFSAPMDNPPFDRSALDGYAVRSQDIRSASPDAPVRLRVVGSALAGHPSPAAVEEGCALRIMTGAVMPAGSDCVIRQEDTDCGEETVSIFQAVGAGKNYARRGEDIAKDSLLLSAGQKITPAEMGILASMGVTDIPVSARPRVALLSTGDELALPGQPLKPGCIYNSSLCLLAARLRELGAEPTVIELLRDDPAAAALRIRDIVLQGAADLILTTGGVSVGQKDIFHQVVPMSGGELIFWRLKIKPGSPVMFWKLGETPILSLSGNPFAAYATFELLARPALGKLLGTASLALRPAQAVLASPFEKSGGLRRFLRGTYAGGQVFLPENHFSGSLQSLKGCNCLVDIPAGSPPLSPGDRVTILAEDWLLPPQKEGGR